MAPPFFLPFFSKLSVTQSVSLTINYAEIMIVHLIIWASTAIVHWWRWGETCRGQVSRQTGISPASQGASGWEDTAGPG